MSEELNLSRSQVHCCLHQSYCPYLTYIICIACRNIAHASYPEILQFIIHEVDGVLMLAGIQILQRRRELHIIILSGDALG